MKTFVLLVTILLICGCDCDSQQRLPTKNEFIRVGFIDGKESCIQIKGTGVYEIRYDDLVQQIIENPEQSCESGYEKIATDVRFFSVITEHEYNIKTGINQQ